VLQPKNCDIEKARGLKHGRRRPGTHFCNTCHLWTDTPEEHAKATPVPLTWPEAMKWRDWAVGEFGVGKLEEAMLGIYNPNRCFKDFYFQEWLLSPHCTPEHYIKAACLCVIRQKGKEV